MNTPSSQIGGIAPELLDLVLSYLGPHDLTSFGRTCQRAYAFIQPTNTVLWRSAFLHVFDDPKNSWARLPPSARAENQTREVSWNWFLELHRRYTAFNDVCEASNGTPLSSIEHVVTALLDVFETASFSGGVSKNLNFLDRLFCKAPGAESLVHDYNRDAGTISLPAEYLGDDRPITRSLVARGSIIPEWASRFHVSLLVRRR